MYIIIFKKNAWQKSSIFYFSSKNISPKILFVAFFALIPFLPLRNPENEVWRSNIIFKENSSPEQKSVLHLRILVSLKKDIAIIILVGSKWNSAAQLLLEAEIRSKDARAPEPPPRWGSGTQMGRNLVRARNRKSDFPKSKWRVWQDENRYWLQNLSCRPIIL